MKRRLKCSYCSETLKGKDITICPHCGKTSKWLSKPTIERELFELQEKFKKVMPAELQEKYIKEVKDKPEYEQNIKVKTDFNKIINSNLVKEFYLKVYDYSQSLFKKFLKSKAIAFPEHEFAEKHLDIVYKWFEDLCYRPQFEVKESWAGYLRWKIIEVLYTKKKQQQDKELSLDMENDDMPNSKSFLETGKINIFNIADEVVDNPYLYNPILLEELKRVLRDIFSKINTISKKESILTSLAFLNFVAGKNLKENALYNFYGNNLKDNTEKVKLIVRKYLRMIAYDEENN